jgi:hypothetical protein
MNIIIKPKGGGKTTEAIRLSAKHWYYIVCLSRNEAYRISKEAQKLDLDIPFPLSFEDLVLGRFSSNIDGFIIDNVDMLLQQLARGVKVDTLTFTSPEVRT